MKLKYTKSSEYKFKLLDISKGCFQFLNIIPTPQSDEDGNDLELETWVLFGFAVLGKYETWSHGVDFGKNNEVIGLTKLTHIHYYHRITIWWCGVSHMWTWK